MKLWKQGPKRNLTFEQQFPTKKARDAADRAIELLDCSLAMTVFTDTWLRIYVKSGGLPAKGCEWDSELLDLIRNS